MSDNLKSFEYDISLNNKTYTTVFIIEKYREKNNLNQKEMLNIIDEFSVLQFLETEYERLHLYGELGMIEHLENYIEHKKKGEEYDTFLG